MKVFVGLSGGVDSGVSAALLKQQGHDVTGVFIRIVVPGYPCTAGADKIDAMRVAAHLKIPFREIDLSKEYKRQVFDESIKEFEKGRTPNPDAVCNREIKFGLFYEWARSTGADMVATGHYARIKDGLLYAGADKDKDQSYFLALVPKEVFAHVLFPIGHLQKTEVRRLAKKVGLPNAERPDSQGLCFLGPVSIGEMLHHELSPMPGDVLSEAGDVIGVHEGAMLYTLGQRHGFTLAIHSPKSAPHYVTAKDPAFNTITVSPNKFPRGAAKTELELKDANWVGDAPEGACHARYRYRQALIPAKIQRGLLKNGVEGEPVVILQEPHYAPLGQVLVLYAGERCIGGGVIKKSRVY